MPFYKWKGINLFGNIVKGRSFAKNSITLGNNLLDLEIGLMHSKEVILLSQFFITEDMVTNMLYKIAILLKSGVRLYYALKTVQVTISNSFLKLILEEISKDIINGSTFNQAISYYPNIFNQLTLTLIKSSEQTGNLSDILFDLCTHKKALQEFKEKTLNALITPIITFVCFIFIALIIFIFMVPKIALILQSFNKPIPTTTQTIINISNYICGLNLIKTILGLITIFIIFFYYFKTKIGKQNAEKIILKIPIISNIIKANYYTYFLQTLTTLIKGNITLSTSLDLIANSIKNSLITSQIKSISKSIKSGRTLTQAIKESSFFNTHELTTLIYIGESSSELCIMLEQANLIYQAQFYQILNNINTYIQPLLLIILAILIGALVLSVYLPIFSLSEII